AQGADGQIRERLHGARLVFGGLAFEGLAFEGLAFEGLAFEGLAFEGLAFEGWAFRGVGVRRRQDEARRGMETGKGPGHSRRIGNGKARRKAEALETMRKIGNELFFSAEERSRACDVEEEAVGAIL